MWRCWTSRLLRMAVFHYVAMSHDGRRLSGALEAQNRSDAFRKLDRQRLQPISLETQEAANPEAVMGKKPAPEDKPGQSAPVRGIRLSRSQIILLTEEMSDLLDAGLQL